MILCEKNSAPAKTEVGGSGEGSRCPLCHPSNCLGVSLEGVGGEVVGTMPGGHPRCQGGCDRSPKALPPSCSASAPANKRAPHRTNRSTPSLLNEDPPHHHQLLLPAGGEASAGASVSNVRGAFKDASRHQQQRQQQCFLPLKKRRLVDDDQEVMRSEMGKQEHFSLLSLAVRITPPSYLDDDPKFLEAFSPCCGFGGERMGDSSWQSLKRPFSAADKRYSLLPSLDEQQPLLRPGFGNEEQLPIKKRRLFDELRGTQSSIFRDFLGNNSAIDPTGGRKVFTETGDRPCVLRSLDYLVSADGSGKGTGSCLDDDALYLSAIVTSKDTETSGKILTKHSCSEDTRASDNHLVSLLPIEASVPADFEEVLSLYGSDRDFCSSGQVSCPEAAGFLESGSERDPLTLFEGSVADDLRCIGFGAENGWVEAAPSVMCKAASNAPPAAQGQPPKVVLVAFSLQPISQGDGAPSSSSSTAAKEDIIECSIQAEHDDNEDDDDDCGDDDEVDVEDIIIAAAGVGGVCADHFLRRNSWGAKEELKFCLGCRAKGLERKLDPVHVSGEALLHHGFNPLLNLDGNAEDNDEDDDDDDDEVEDPPYVEEDDDDDDDDDEYRESEGAASYSDDPNEEDDDEGCIQSRSERSAHPEVRLLQQGETVYMNIKEEPQDDDDEDLVAGDESDEEYDPFEDNGATVYSAGMGFLPLQIPGGAAMTGPESHLRFPLLRTPTAATSNSSSMARVTSLASLVKVQTPVRCDECFADGKGEDAVFNTREAATVHRVFLHRHQFCADCELFFGSADEREAHMASAHSSFICEKCAMRCNSSSGNNGAASNGSAEDSDKPTAFIFPSHFQFLLHSVEVHQVFQCNLCTYAITADPSSFDKIQNHLTGHHHVHLRVVPNLQAALEIGYNKNKLLEERPESTSSLKCGLCSSSLSRTKVYNHLRFQHKCWHNQAVKMLQWAKFALHSSSKTTASKTHSFSYKAGLGGPSTAKSQKSASSTALLSIDFPSRSRFVLIPRTEYRCPVDDCRYFSTSLSKPSTAVGGGSTLNDFGLHVLISHRACFCVFCGAFFTSREELIRHTRSVHHPSSTADVCRECKETIRGGRHYLIEHNRVSHGIFICVLCHDAMAFRDPHSYCGHVIKFHEICVPDLVEVQESPSDGGERIEDFLRTAVIAASATMDEDHHKDTCVFSCHLCAGQRFKVYTGGAGNPVTTPDLDQTDQLGRHLAVHHNIQNLEQLAASYDADSLSFNVSNAVKVLEEAYQDLPEADEEGPKAAPAAAAAPAVVAVEEAGRNVDDDDDNPSESAAYPVNSRNSTNAAGSSKNTPRKKPQADQRPGGRPGRSTAKEEVGLESGQFFEQLHLTGVQKLGEENGVVYRLILDEDGYREIHFEHRRQDDCEEDDSVSHKVGFLVGDGNTVQDLTDEERSAVGKYSIFVLCKLCYPMVLPSQMAFNYHMSVMHPAEHAARPFKCDMCDSKYHFRRSLMSHRSKKHNVSGEAQFLCEICSTAVNDRQSMRRHLSRSHHLRWSPDLTGVHLQVMKTYGYLCKYCEVVTWNEKERSAHTALEHPGMEAPGHRCPLCAHTSPTKVSLKRHFKRMHPKDQFFDESCKCDQCGRLFPNKLKLNLHVKEDHVPRSSAVGSQGAAGPGVVSDEEAAGECSDSDEAGEGPSSSNQEAPSPGSAAAMTTASPSGKAPTSNYFCSDCNRPFASVRTWRKHMKNKHTTADDVIRNNTCPECGETFPSARAKTAHFSVAHKDSRSKGRSYPKRGFKCKLCDKTFQAIEHRSVHYKQDHAGERPFKCDVCDKGFSNKGSLAGHRSTHKNDVYTCDQCQKVFARRDSFREHMLIHNGPRYRCPHCTKEFVQKSNLKRHVRIHLGIKPHQCPVCKKCFSDKGACSSHIRTHSREKFKCEICGVEYNWKQKYLYHMRIHSGNLLSCELCFKQFTNSYSLKCHMRSVHARNKKFPCVVCGDLLADHNKLARHFTDNVDHHDFPSFCSLCGFQFASKVEASQHRAANHFDLLDAAVKAKLEDKSQWSGATPDGNDPDAAYFKCCHCIQRFHSQTDVVSHLKGDHGIESNFSLHFKNTMSALPNVQEIVMESKASSESRARAAYWKRPRAQKVDPAPRPKRETGRRTRGKSSSSSSTFTSVKASSEWRLEAEDGEDEDEEDFMMGLGMMAQPDDDDDCDEDSGSESESAATDPLQIPVGIKTEPEDAL